MEQRPDRQQPNGLQPDGQQPNGLQPDSLDYTQRRDILDVEIERLRVIHINLGMPEQEALEFATAVVNSNADVILQRELDTNLRAMQELMIPVTRSSWPFPPPRSLPVPPPVRRPARTQVTQVQIPDSGPVPGESSFTFSNSRSTELFRHLRRIYPDQDVKICFDTAETTIRDADLVTALNAPVPSRSPSPPIIRPVPVTTAVTAAPINTTPVVTAPVVTTASVTTTEVNLFFAVVI